MLSVLIDQQLVTDGQTDRRTDTGPRYSITSRGIKSFKDYRNISLRMYLHCIISMNSTTSVRHDYCLLMTTSLHQIDFVVVEIEKKTLRERLLTVIGQSAPVSDQLKG